MVQAYIDRARPTTAPAPRWSPRTASRLRRRRAPSRRRAAHIPDQDRCRLDSLPGPRRVPGLPLEYGRMEPTLSDPSVQQQWGMRVGIPNAGQVNALETLNIRGERSVTCKGEFDARRGGPLPAGARRLARSSASSPTRWSVPPSSTAVRPQAGSDQAADVLRRLRLEELVRREGHARHRRQRRQLRDGRAEGRFAGRRELRAKGAISFAVATADNAAASARPARRSRSRFAVGQPRLRAWGGQPCNPYDTTRVPRGSSSGSGVAVARTSRPARSASRAGSCKGPASRNGIVNLLTTKGILMDGGSATRSSATAPASTAARWPTP